MTSRKYTPEVEQRLQQLKHEAYTYQQKAYEREIEKAIEKQENYANKSFSLLLLIALLLFGIFRKES